MFTFVQVVKISTTTFQQTASKFSDGNSTDFFGSIAAKKFGSNITDRTVFYVIPQEAVTQAQKDPNFRRQYSVIYFAKNFFASKLNFSQVS